MTTIQLLTADELARCCPPILDDDHEPGFGALRTEKGNLPLKLMDVNARVVGLLSQVELRQTYVNTLGVPLEATYVFPLPDRAAVSRFRFEVGDRVIEGTLKERGEARREYQQAIQTGHRAAITEEERPGVFTMRVGNLMPGEEASVHLTLSGPLPFSDGEATFQFPLVVAPRYIPGTPLSGEAVGDGTALDTDAVPDASRISPPVLLPGFPNPIRLSLQVELDPAGLPLGKVRSSLHAVSEERQLGRRVVRIQPGERLDRDFILRFELGADRIGSSLTLHPDADGEGEGTFQLTVVPPLGRAKGVKPRDVVFVLDRSGSMGGWKMIAARRATARMLDTLTDQDRFAVLAFDNSIERPDRLDRRHLVQATNRNRFRAVEFLAKVEARGGTEMARPLQEAVDNLLEDGDAARDRILILITDGQVGNEDQILRTLGAKLEQMRVFTLGIDRAVNAGFLRRLAGLGGGYCELVESEDRLDEVMDKVHRRIGTPLLTGISLSGEGLDLDLSSVVPTRLPDMFAGAPLRILGRYRGRSGGGLRVSATDGVGRAWSERVSARSTENSAITRVWARGRIRDLEDRYATTSERSLVSTITNTSLRFSVMCRFTSFVAVDRSEIVNAGGQVHQVTQAVEQPEGWGAKPETTARGRASSFGPGSMAQAKLGSGFAAPPPAPACAPSPAPADPFGGAPMGGAGGGGDPFAMPAAAASFDAMDDMCLEAPEESKSDSFRSVAPEPERKPKKSKARRASRARPARRPAPQKRPPSGGKGGFFSRIFGSGGEKAQDKTVRAELTPYKRRLEDLLRLLEGGKDAATELRQRELARLATLLETLIEDLRSVGVAEDSIRPLVDLFRELEVARGGDMELDAIARLERQTGEVLKAFLEGSPAPAGSDRGDSFWF